MSSCPVGCVATGERSNWTVVSDDGGLVCTRGLIVESTTNAAFRVGSACILVSGPKTDASAREDRLTAYMRVPYTTVDGVAATEIVRDRLARIGQDGGDEPRDTRTVSPTSCGGAPITVRALDNGSAAIAACLPVARDMK